MKKLITTMQIGDKGKAMWDICTPTIKKYAEKVGADFKIIDKNRIEWKHYGFYMQKLQMFDFLFEYDQVLMLDSDILITTLAPNVFEEFTERDTFYGMDEGYTDRAHLVQPYIDEYNVDWQLNEYGTPKHYNGGVWLFGNGACYDYNITEYLPIKGYEENFVNYIIQRNKIKNVNMDRKWNKICSDDTIPRREAYFIHYAGPGHVEYKNKSEIWSKKMALVKSDYEYFYA